MKCRAYCACLSAFTRQFAENQHALLHGGLALNGQWSCTTTQNTEERVYLEICHRAPIRTEKVNPSAKLNTFQIPLKPVESQMQPLHAARDQLPQGRTIHALLLTYKLSLEAEGKHRVTVPMLNRYQIIALQHDVRVTDYRSISKRLLTNE